MDVEIVIQAHTQYGWEDVSQCDTLAEAREELAEYRMSDPVNPYRIKTRPERG